MEHPLPEAVRLKLIKQFLEDLGPDESARYVLALQNVVVQHPEGERLIAKSMRPLPAFLGTGEFSLQDVQTLQEMYRVILTLSDAQLHSLGLFPVGEKIDRMRTLVQKVSGPPGGGKRTPRGHGS